MKKMRMRRDNSSNVICDMRDPSAFTTGMIVPVGGTISRRFWNKTNTGLSITIPIDNDQTLTDGVAHFFFTFNAPPSRQLYPPAYNIEANHIGTNYTITFADSVFEGLTGFAENASVEIYSIIWDAPGNSTRGDTSSSIIKIDQTEPTLIGRTIFSTNNDQLEQFLAIQFNFNLLDNRKE
jgi:hypothetical protein